MAGDWTAAVTAATIGLGLMVPAVYLPLLFWIRSRETGRQPWVYSAACTLAAALPWLVVGGLWGGPGVIFTLVSAEAQFVYVIFGPAGAIFGFVFWFFQVRVRQPADVGGIHSGAA